MLKIISAYFSGSSFSIDDGRFLTTNLFRETISDNNEYIKFGFNGCGVEYSIAGLLFGSGLNEQADQVIQRVIEELNDGHEVILNLHGMSRGAVGALLLAKQLSAIDPEKLTINLSLLDPVPGNALTTAALDPLQICLANKTIDLSNCKPLKNVLALYPHEPLFSFLFHAPLMVTYPKGEQVTIEEEVIAGCHAEAEDFFNPSYKVARLRIEKFLTNNGTQFAYPDPFFSDKYLISRYVQDLKTLNKNKKASTRATHSAEDVYIKTEIGAKYLNKHHRALMGGTEQDSVALSIEPSIGPFSWLRRTAKKYPLITRAIKWGIFGLGVGAILFFSGGLAAIPFLAGLGALGIIIVAPLAPLVLAPIWYGLKPTLLSAANNFYYPKYSLRTLTVSVPSNGSMTALSQLNLGAVDSPQADYTMPHQPKVPIFSDKSEPRPLWNGAFAGLYGISEFTPS